MQIPFPLPPIFNTRKYSPVSELQLSAPISNCSDELTNALCKSTLNLQAYPDL
jgi:hypothetical protein